MLYSIDSVDINLWNVFFDMKSVLEQPMTLGSPTGYVVDVSGHRGSEASRMLHTDLLPHRSSKSYGFRDGLDKGYLG